MPVQLSKAEWRLELRRRRQALTGPEQLAAAQAVAGQVQQLPGWNEAHSIALYLSRDGEIDTAPLIELCRRRDLQLFLPVIGIDNSLSFARWHREARLCDNRYGIPEPPSDATRCPANDLDILILPLVGWDRAGGRLGMGGGFYDRTLSDVSATLLVGLAHSVQELDRVPSEEWDISVDFVATDTALHHCRKPN